VQGITAPASTNLFLHQQDGFFTLSFGPHATPIDELLLQERAKHAVLQGVELLRRYTLPVDEARELLKRLSFEGVDRCALFPSYEGAARGVREQIAWEGLNVEREYKR
jgi:hypothetical protein